MTSQIHVATPELAKSHRAQRGSRYSSGLVGALVAGSSIVTLLFAHNHGHGSPGDKGGRCSWVAGNGRVRQPFVPRLPNPSSFGSGAACSSGRTLPTPSSRGSSGWI